ncbi:MAG: glycosyltransferase, partial [Planctomycetota bacterium]|nr:glycosyltransferase [Planctomycetota bacterium]
ACRAAAAVVVFSSAYRDEVPRRYDLDPASVWITPVGCEHWTRKLPDPPPRPTPPHLLVLGAIRRPRRPLAVLEAFACLRDGGVEARLTFVGHPGDAAEAFRPALDAHAHRTAITWIERPIEKDMPGLAAGATLLVHLAEDEGSPVTPLELFAYGRGVVAAELPAYREALGDLAVHVPQDASPRELSDAIAGALVEPTVADGERVAVAAGYRWDTTARRTLEVWQHVFEASKNARR